MCDAAAISSTHAAAGSDEFNELSFFVDPEDMELTLAYFGGASGEVAQAVRGELARS